MGGELPMNQAEESPRTFTPRRLAKITILALGCVLAGRAVMPWEKMFPDFICYYAAARIVADGQSPYDLDSQTRVQKAYGWDRVEDGRGVLDFLPYYYPPWFAMALVPLVPLGFGGAKLAWFFLNTWMLLASGVVLRDVVPGVPRRIPVVLVPVFFFSVTSLLLGQTTIAILFLIAISWSLLERGRDGAAGSALAGVATKPQLAGLLLLGIAIWAWRRRRWGVARGILITLALLVLSGALVAPSWPWQMLDATRRTPPPTVAFPWIGASWFLILRSLGLRSWTLGAAYLVGAVPLVAAVVAAAFDRSRPLRDTIAASLIAAFLVVPYGRSYDYPVLLVPLFVLLGGRLSEKAGAALLAAVTLIPYIQFPMLVKYHDRYTKVNFFLESTFFWVPLLLAACWLATEARAIRAGAGSWLDSGECPGRRP